MTFPTPSPLPSLDLNAPSNVLYTVVFSLTVFLIFFTFVLKALSNLVELDLSHNKIAILGSNLNTKLGNIKKLNLAGNELDSVQGTKF